MTRSFWPVGEAAQADYEQLRSLASVAGAERPTWSPYEDPRELVLADGYQIIVAASAAAPGEEQTG
jgi:hypothetical protein